MSGRAMADPGRAADEEILRALELRDRGWSYARIAAQLPSRSRNGWLGLLRRLDEDVRRSEQAA